MDQQLHLCSGHAVELPVAHGGVEDAGEHGH